MIHGFHISQFRNFGDEPQLVGPLGKVNIFIGGNNSGKSNVLRFVRDVISPLLHSTPGKPVALTPINRSRFASTLHNSIGVLIPITEETIARAFNPPDEPTRKNWTKFFRGLPGSLEDDELILIPALRSPQNRQRVDPSALNATGVDERTAHRIWASTGRSGGNFGQNWYPEIMDVLYQAGLSTVDCLYVPSFRQLDTRLPDFKDEYVFRENEEHIIDELAVFYSPPYYEQEKRQSFEKLRNFIADIADCPDIKIDIPHDRRTINVNMNGEVMPLEALGSGIHELFMLASRIVLSEGKVVLLEEPEVHMHPEFQRKFMIFIRDQVDSQFFITTHSSVVIDTDGAKVFGVSSDSGRAIVRPLLQNQSRREVCRELGYRASDLLQANSIVWVEGPSDRIYLKHWLHAVAPDLREGIEFSIMFYGGKLLSHLSAEDAEVEDFITLLPINRYPALLVDSDLGSTAATLRPTKQRVLKEVEQIGGYGWVTLGREVESYVPRAIREAAVKAVHKKATSLAGARTRWGKPLDYTTAEGRIVTDKFDKVAIARQVTRVKAELNELDLLQKLHELEAFIRKANRSGA